MNNAFKLELTGKIFSSLVFTLFLLAAASSGVGGDSQAAASLDVEGFSNITLTAFTITPSEIFEGSTADFSVTAENRGNVEDALSLNVSISNASGELYVINYTPVNVTPGSTVTLTTTWSSAGYALGNYSANASGRYGVLGANATNSLAANFSITNATPTPTPSPSPSASPTPTPGGGGGAAPTPTLAATPTVLPTPTPGAPTTIPPSVKPKTGVISFSRKTVLQEVVAGDGVVLTLDFKNDGAEAFNGEIVFSGLPAGTPPVAPKSVTLQPQASSSIDVALWIPAAAVAGDYVVSVRVLALDGAARREVTTEYLFLRVKRYPSDYANPIVLRRVRLDAEAKTTNVVLSVRNPTLKAMDSVDVIEVIPTPLAVQPDGIVFLDKIGSYVADKPLTLAWRLTNVEPSEKGVISYSLKTLSDDYAVYGSWFTKQVTTSRSLRLSDLLTITSFAIQGVRPGGKTKASFSVFYGGLAPLEASATLSLPSGFKSTPQTIRNVVFASRSTQEFEFEIAVDDSIEPGAYSARAIVMALDSEVSSPSSVIVLPFEFGFDNAILLSILVILAAIAFMFWRRYSAPQSFYDRDRFAYANSLRRIVFGEEKQ